MAIDSTGTDKDQSQAFLPEIDIYLHLLVMIHLLDTKNYEQVST